MKLIGVFVLGNGNAFLYAGLYFHAPTCIAIGILAILIGIRVIMADGSA